MKYMHHAFTIYMLQSIAMTSGVPADCSITFHPIPASSGSQQCSGHGAPVAALGTCQCYVGYDATNCDVCADGYQLVGGICQRTLTSFKAQAALAAIAQSSASTTQKVCVLPSSLAYGVMICCTVATLYELEHRICGRSIIFIKCGLTPRMT